MTDETPASGSTQAPPAAMTSAHVDDFQIVSASSIAPHESGEALAESFQELGGEEPEHEPTEPLVPEPSEPTEPEEPEEPAKPEPSPEKPKRKQTVTERHQEMLAQIHAASRELKEVATRTAQLREQAESWSKIPIPQPKPAAEAKPDESPAPTDGVPKERPRWKDYEANGQSFDEYEEDRHKYEEARDARTKAEVETQLRQRQEAERVAADEAAFVHRVNEARVKHPDWDDTIHQNLRDVPETPFMKNVVKHHPQGAELFYEWAKQPEIAKTWAAYDRDPRFRPNQAVFSALFESQQPFAVLEHLATHRDEYERLLQLPPVSALLALGKLDSALAGAKNGSPARRPVSNAAPPLSHRAGAQSSGSGGVPDETLDIEDYVRAMNKREGKRSPI